MHYTDVFGHESINQHDPTYTNNKTKALPSRTAVDAAACKILRLTSWRSALYRFRALGLKFKVQEVCGVEGLRTSQGFSRLRMQMACAASVPPAHTSASHFGSNGRKFDSNRGDFKVVKKRVYVVSPQSMSNLGQTRTSELAAHPLHGSLPSGENKTTMVRPSIENFEPKTGTCQKRAIATYSHH